MKGLEQSTGRFGCRRRQWNRRPLEVQVERAELDVDVETERVRARFGDRLRVEAEEGRPDVDREGPLGRRRDADRHERGEDDQRPEQRSRQARSKRHASRKARVMPDRDSRPALIRQRKRPAESCRP